VHAVGGVDGGAQRIEGDRGRRQVGIPAPEIDQPRPRQPARGRGRGDDPGEVLLGEAREELRRAMNVQDV
jgi:hypothetical protein